MMPSYGFNVPCISSIMERRSLHARRFTLREVAFRSFSIYTDSPWPNRMPSKTTTPIIIVTVIIF